MKKSIIILVIFIALSGILVSHYNAEQNGVTSIDDKISFDKVDYKKDINTGIENYTRAGYTIYKNNNSAFEKLNLNEYYVYYEDKLELQLNEENYKYVLSFFFPEFNFLFAN